MLLRFSVSIPLLALLLTLAVGGCADDSAPTTDAGVDVADTGADAALPDAARDIGTDADDVAVDPPDMDSAPDAEPLPCPDDNIGETSSSEPLVVSEMPFGVEASICPDEDDWFGFDVVAGEELRLDLTFDHDAGNLDMFIVDDRFITRGRADSETDDEALVYVAREDGRLRARVYGGRDTTNTYELRADVTSAFAGCDDDPEEPNDNADNAFPIEPPSSIEARLCADDLDVFVVDVPADSLLAATLVPSFGDGRGQLRLLPEGADPIAAAPSDEPVQLAFGPIDEDRRVMIDITGELGAIGTYTLDVVVESGEPVAATAEGTVTYEDRIYGPEGFTGELVVRPARGVIVEVVRTLDQQVVAEAQTDSDGRFAASFEGTAGFSYHARALAWTEVDGLSALVEDRTSEHAIYAVASPPASLRSDGSLDLAVDGIADDSSGGALNIADVAYDALTFMRVHTDAEGDPLAIRWERGRAFSCGSCYFSDTISLGGQIEDPDQYDDDIILHEIGHYIIDNFSDDSSPGGSHNGDRTDPRLAYGEGAAHAFSAMVRDTAEYVDNYLDSNRFRDFEAADEDADEYFGTSDETLGGDVSEFLVAAVLWDAYDDNDDEAFDDVSVGAEGIMSVWLDYMNAPGRIDVGARGIELSDWLSGAACVLSDDAAAIASLAVDERAFPWSEESTWCEKATHRSPFELRANDGTIWLVPRNPSTAREPIVEVHHVRSGIDRSSTVTCDTLPCRIGVASPEVLVLARPLGDERWTSWVGEDMTARLRGGHVGHGPRGWLRVLRPGFESATPGGHDFAGSSSALDASPPSR